MKTNRKCTSTGRIVYKRKKHYFSLSRVVHILEKLSVTLTTKELKENPYMCNALFEIVRTAFYPVWQNALHKDMQNTIAKQMGSEVEGVLRGLFQEQVFEVCHTIGEKMGVPDYVRDAVIDYFGQWIWDVIWKITDPFFKS